MRNHGAPLLRKLEKRKDVAALIEMLRSGPDPETRRGAAEALGLVAQRRDIDIASEAFEAALDDEQTAVCEAAKRAAMTFMLRVRTHDDLTDAEQQRISRLYLALL